MYAGQTDRQTHSVTLSNVVIARVAMLRLESVMRFSRSTLHAVTAAGCFIATYVHITRHSHARTHHTLHCHLRTHHMPLSHTYTSHACSHNSTVNINITYNIANSLLTVPPRDVVSECRTHLFCCMINTHVTSGAQLVMPYQHTDTSKLNVSVTKGCLVGCK